MLLSPWTTTKQSPCSCCLTRRSVFSLMLVGITFCTYKGENNSLMNQKLLAANLCVRGVLAIRPLLLKGLLFHIGKDLHGSGLNWWKVNESGRKLPVCLCQFHIQIYIQIYLCFLIWKQVNSTMNSLSGWLCGSNILRGLHNCWKYLFGSKQILYAVSLNLYCHERKSCNFSIKDSETSADMLWCA